MTVEERRQILDEELRRIVELIIKEYSPEKIIFFGSLATNTIHEWSDIDLVIIKDTNKRFLDRIEELLFMIYPKVGMNLVVYTPQEFKNMLDRKHYFILEEILKKGKVLYERDKQLV